MPLGHSDQQTPLRAPDGDLVHQPVDQEPPPAVLDVCGRNGPRKGQAGRSALILDFDHQEVGGYAAPSADASLAVLASNVRDSIRDRLSDGNLDVLALDLVETGPGCQRSYPFAHQGHVLSFCWDLKLGLRDRFYRHLSYPSHNHLSVRGRQLISLRHYRITRSLCLPNETSDDLPG